MVYFGTDDTFLVIIIYHLPTMAYQDTRSNQQMISVTQMEQIVQQIFKQINTNTKLIPHLLKSHNRGRLRN